MNSKFGHFARNNLVIAVVLLWFVWLGYSMLDTNLNVKNIASLGTLGDSFGAVNSLFASLALIYTAMTNQAQNKQLAELSRDRKMQYYKQLYDLYFLDAKVSKAYYLIEHGYIRFFPKPLLENRSNYWELDGQRFDRVELESQLDALFSTADLTLYYMRHSLLESADHFEYKIKNILSNPHIRLYLTTLKEFNTQNGVVHSPFPNLYKYFENLPQ